LSGVFDWVSRPSNHGIRIVFEAVHHSVLILVLDLGVRLFHAALAILDHHLPHGQDISYLNLDTSRAMVTIADVVMVILFGFLAIRTILRFVCLLRGGPK
jgi:hypothetical protein